MYLEVDAFPELVLVHAPTLERGQDVGTPPDRWVFTDSRHPMLDAAVAGGRGFAFK